jgi:hypothetical protein
MPYLQHVCSGQNIVRPYQSVIPSKVKGSAAVTRSETTITRTQPDHIRRVTGLCGVAGALLFFGGDMLFYGYFGAGSSFADGMRTTVAQASTQRLFAGGLIGPIAACLCIVGFWHVYLNVRPSSELFRRVMLAAFFILMVGGSAVHTLWTAKGLALKYCYGQGPPCSDLLTIIKSYWTVAYNLTSIPGYFGSLLLMGLVLTRRTWYPRWTVLVNPGVLILLSPVAAKMPSPLGAILVGGSANLSIALFFLTSVALTWAHRTEA